MLKADARRRTVSCQPSPILAGVILFALGMLISTLTSYLMGMDRLATALTDAARFGTEAVEQAYLSFLEHYSVSGFAIALVVALRIMSYMVSVGFVIFALHISRDEKAEFGNLFDGFGLFFRVLWLGILEGLLIFLWSLLLCALSYVAGFFKLCGTFECMSNIQLWMTAKRDFTIFFPLLYCVVLGNMSLSPWMTEELTYVFQSWHAMHWFMAACMLPGYCHVPYSCKNTA